jgi:hypothetical protein
VTDRLAGKLERKVLPHSARELTNADLSDTEALVLALFAEGRVGDRADEREEKIALARVLEQRAATGRTGSTRWGRAIEQHLPSYRGPRWQIGAAIRFERMAMLTPELRAQWQEQQARLRGHYRQAVEVADLALAGVLPINTPAVDRFASATELTDAKARGLVVPSTLVQYGDHAFFASRSTARPRRGRAGARSKANRAPARSTRASRRKEGSPVPAKKKTTKKAGSKKTGTKKPGYGKRKS